MKIIIPMSGIGKRFIEAGYDLPKPLIIVENKPIIEHVINLFPNEEYIFICNDLHLQTTHMRNILLKIAPNCKIYEVSVDNRKGPVDAVLQIADKEINDNDEIIISYCDYGTKWDYERFKNDIYVHSADGAIPCYTDFHPHMLGSDNYAFVRECNMNFIEIAEKTKLSPKTVSAKLKELERKKVIMGYFMALDTTKFGYGLYKLIIQLNRSKQDNELESSILTIMNDECRQIGKQIV
jgi:NDP-sugar pyrophosphorylase family protein